MEGDYAQMKRNTIFIVALCLFIGVLYLYLSHNVIGYQNSVASESRVLKPFSKIARTLPGDTYVDNDWIGLPPGTPVVFPGDLSPHTIGTDAFATIGLGILNAIPGATVYVAPGTYSETNTIAKSLNIVGSGDGTNPLNDTMVTSTTNHAFIIQSSNIRLDSLWITTNQTTRYGIYCDVVANNLQFNNLTITRSLLGIYFDYHANVQNVSIINCDISFQGNSCLFFSRRDATRESAKLNGLLIEGCNFADSLYGVYVYQPHLPPFPMRFNDFLNVVVRNTTFTRIGNKGLYFERLSNAVFDNITLTDCGITPGYLYCAGLELNLKYGDYSNITITNSSFEGSGLNNGPVSVGAAINVKARADAAYAANPATLDNLSISNCTIENCRKGLYFERPTTSVTVSDTYINGCTGGVLVIGVDIDFVRCTITNNNLTMPPLVNISNTYGIAVVGRLYPDEMLGALLETIKCESHQMYHLRQFVCWSDQH